MNEDLASKLSSLLEENNIDLNQILENFNQSQNSENPSKNQKAPTSNNPPNDTNTIVFFKNWGNETCFQRILSGFLFNFFQILKKTSHPFS